MICPSRDDLARLLDERLAAPDAALVEFHVEQCLACQDTLTQLARSEFLALSPGIAVDRRTPAPELRADFLQLLRQSMPVAADAPSQSTATTTGPKLPDVAGYQILGEVGRGGLGVVYRARDSTLGRVVALKMILAGMHAGQRDRDRFNAEAAAVARLQHPNIVQIFAVGDENGCPYLALEYVPGGTLAQKLNGAPIAPRSAAELVETVARALHVVHGQGIVHRDLKPANVLLTADGTPKVTDFGLAKQLDVGSANTQTGAILGTPSYMSPEQAAGARTHIGPAADVYALGAILYEMLTGRPPFRGATPAETLQQVQFSDPVPPSGLQPGLLRDLESVCLKCLEKDPARRYASAEALAGDLRCFLNGRPTAARPAGPWEKLAKWTRRNPRLAAAIAGIAVTLIAGTGFSTYFGIRAARQASAAATANNNLETANTNLRQSHDELEATLARSLLRALGQNPTPGPLTGPEVEAITELANAPTRSLRLRFVEEAVRQPATARQLRACAPYAIHAVVGLDADLRDEVEQILVGRMNDATLDSRHRADVALAAVALGGLTADGAAAVTRTLTEVTARNFDPYLPGAILPALVAVTDRRDRAEAARLSAPVAEALTELLLNSSQKMATGSMRAIASALANVSARIDPAEGNRQCARAAEAIRQALPRAIGSYQIQDQVQALAALADRVDRGDSVRLARAAADFLTDQISKTADPPALGMLVRSLSLLFRHLDAGASPAYAARAADHLVTAIRRTTRTDELDFLGQGLSVVAPDLTVVGVDRLTAALLEHDDRVQNNQMASYRLMQMLTGLVRRAGAVGARRVGDAALRAIRTPKNAGVAGRFGGPLAAAEALDATVVDQLVDELIKIPSSAGGPATLDAFPILVNAIRFRITPAAARRLGNAIMDAFRKEPDVGTQVALTVALNGICGRLDANHCRRACLDAAEILTRTLTCTSAPYDQLRLATACTTLVDWLARPDAARISAAAVRTLSASLPQTVKDPLMFDFHCANIVSFARRMDQADAAPVLKQVISMIDQVVPTTKDFANLAELINVLSDAAEQVSPADAARIADSVRRVIDSDVNCVNRCSRFLPHLAAATESEQALQTAEIVLRAMTMAPTTDPNLQAVVLPESLIAILTGYTPRKARARSAALLLTASPIGPGPSHTASMTALAFGLEPPPCRFTTPELLRLLKHPLCTGAALRCVINQLEARYRRPFADQWEFLSWAEQGPHGGVRAGSLGGL